MKSYSKRKVVFTVVTGAVFTVLYFTPLRAQEAQAPVYKDGDWWKVKVEVSYQQGVTRSGAQGGACSDSSAEYVVKMEQGKPHVYVSAGDTQKPIDCPGITTRLLGSGSEADEAEPDAKEAATGEYLKFPLKVGQSWKSSQTTKGQRIAGRTRLGGTRDLEYKVVSWEKVATPKEELEAFKIDVSGRSGSLTYYYSPKVKAIVRFEQKPPDSDNRNRVSATANRSVTLVDFGVGQ